MKRTPDGLQNIAVKKVENGSTRLPDDIGCHNHSGTAQVFLHENVIVTQPDRTFTIEKN